MSNFGNKLKTIRKSRNITQGNLAKDLKLAQSTIANYENNIRFPGSETLRDLSDYLNISVDYLLGLDPMEEENIEKNDFDLENLYIQLVDILVDGRVEEAKKIVKDLNDSGVDSISMIEKVFLPMLKLVGEKWEKNEIFISEEHLITEIIEKLFSYISETRKIEASRRFKAMFMVPPGEDHLITLKMSTEYFRIRGWDVRFIGRSIPVYNLIKSIKKEKIDLLVLSSMTQESTNTASYMVEAIRTNLKEKSPLILLGGAAVNDFNRDLISTFADYALDTLDDLSLKIVEVENKILKVKG